MWLKQYLFIWKMYNLNYLYNIFIDLFILYYVILKYYILYYIIILKYYYIILY